MPYYDLLEELFSGVGASGRFARTGAIESEAERDGVALRDGLELGETAELEQAEETISSQLEQDLVVIGSAMPNNSTLTDADIVDDGTITGSSSQDSNSLVRSRSGLSNEDGGDSGEMSNGGHRHKRVCTNKNSQGALANALLALRDEAVEQRLQSQSTKEEEAINKLLELYADSDEYTEAEITKLVLALQERKNAIGFLAIVKFPGIRTNWIAAQLVS